MTGIALSIENVGTPDFSKFRRWCERSARRRPVRTLVYEEWPWISTTFGSCATRTSGLTHLIAIG
jgi:hypothetical protein